MSSWSHSWLTEAEFEVLRGSPAVLFDKANKQLHMLYSALAQLQNEHNAMLLDPRFQRAQTLHKFKASQAELLNLRSQESEMNEKLSSLLALIETLRRDKTRLFAQVGELKLELANKARENANLELLEGEYTLIRRVLDLKISEQSNQLEALNAELERYQLQVEEMEAAIGSLQDTRTKLETETAQVQQKETELQRSRPASAALIQSVEREIGERAARLADCSEEFVRVKAQLSAELLEAERALCVAEETKDITLSRAAQEAQTFADQRQWLQDCVGARHKEVAALRSERARHAAAARAESRALSDMATSLSSSVDAATLRNSALEQELSSKAAAAKSKHKNALLLDSQQTADVAAQSQYLCSLHCLLQTTREGIILMRPRLCNRCKNLVPAAEALQMGTVGPFISPPAPHGPSRTEAVAVPVSAGAQAEYNSTRRMEPINTPAANTVGAPTDYRHGFDRSLTLPEPTSHVITRLPDGSQIKVGIAPTDSIADVTDRIRQSLGMSLGDPTAQLFRVVVNVVDASGTSVDVIPPLRSNANSAGIVPGATVRFHAPWTKVPKGHADEVAVAQLFRQVKQYILTERWPTSERMVVSLAGLALQVAFGDFSGSAMTKYTAERGLGAWLPPSILSPQLTTQYWTKRLAAAHKLHRGMSQNAARLAYLRASRDGSPFWGMEFTRGRSFVGQGRQDTAVNVGVAEDGLFVLPPNHKAFVNKTFTFDVLRSWQVSPQGLSLGLRNVDAPFEISMSKAAAERTCVLLTGFVALLDPATRARCPHLAAVNTEMPPAEAFEHLTTSHHVHVFVGGRLERLKASYLEYMRTPAKSGAEPLHLKAFCEAVDFAMDSALTLTTLDLSSSCISDDTFAAIVGMLSIALAPSDKDKSNTAWKEDVSISTLNLADNALTPASIPALATLLKLLPTLTCLDVSGMVLGDTHAQLLANVLSSNDTCPRLHELLMRGCGIGARGFQYFEPLFTKKTPLSLVNVNSNRLTFGALEPVLEKRTLTSFSARDNALDDKILQFFARISTANAGSVPVIPATIDLDNNSMLLSPNGTSALVRLLESSCGIISISVNNCGASPEDAVRILSAASASVQLASISMSSTPIPSRYSSQLSEGFRHIRSLRKLALVNCGLSDDSGSAIADAVAISNHVTSLDCSDNSIAAGGMLPPHWAVVIAGATMKELVLCNVGLSADGALGALEIAAARPSSAPALSLSLNRNNFARATVGDTKPLLTLSLCLLSIQDCKIDDASLEAFASILASTRVVRLEIDDNPISCGGIEAFSMRLSKNIFLKEISLKNTIHSNERSAAASMLLENTKIEEVML